MKVLSYYPIHPVLINNLAEFFPSWKFDLVWAIANPLFTEWEQFLPYFYWEPNITLLDITWEEVEEDYDLTLLHPRATDLANIQIQMPAIFVVLSSDKQPPPNWNGKVVYSNFFSKSKGKYPGEVILLSNSYKKLGRWRGDLERFYFSPKITLNMKSEQELNRKITTELPFWLPESYVPWLEFSSMRRRCRGYIELSQRDNSCAFMDALKLGQPVIAPKIRDYPYFIENGKTGFLWSTPQEIIEIGKKLLSDYEFAKEIGEAAFQKAKVLIDEKKIKGQWEKVFEEAISEKEDIK